MTGGISTVSRKSTAQRVIRDQYGSFGGSSITQKSMRDRDYGDDGGKHTLGTDTGYTKSSFQRIQ